MELAAAFHGPPDAATVVDMSEVWFWRSLIYLNEKGQSQRKGDAASAPPADMIVYDDEGNPRLAY